MLSKSVNPSTVRLLILCGATILPLGLSPESVLAEPQAPVPKDGTLRGANEMDLADVDVAVGLGYVAMSQDFRTSGTCDFCAYKLSTGAPATSLESEYRYQALENVVASVNLQYQYARAIDGIYLTDPSSGASSTIGFSRHRADLNGALGYRFGTPDGFAVHGRAGVHYERFGIDDATRPSENLAQLPSETLVSVTAGGFVDVPFFTPKIALRLGLDLLVTGSRGQTRGLEDGLEADLSAIGFHGRVEYQFLRLLKATAQYRYNRVETNWRGNDPGSGREHQMDANTVSAARLDRDHSLVLGLRLLL